MPVTDPQAQTLVAEYLRCLEAKAAADGRFQAAKADLLEYSRQKNKKTIRTDKASVVVSVKRRTVFPKYNQPGRKELEKLVRAAGYWQEAQSFDVIKLAEAYDADQLPRELKEKLTPLAKSESQARIFVNPN